ncbi:MAG TPA: FmdB family zinc ribbon protein [Candidatus Dormibacteraeota bacterium]|nr:FmdB family zinc ribbon protein [Candidatus Dormibacteraeota bacterium]
MPLYEYQCVKCGRRTEKIESVDGPHLKKCPHCGGKVERLLAPPAIQFKGAGWYVTDYAKKTGGDSEKMAAGATETVGKEKSGDSKETVSKDSKEKKSAKKK